MNSMQIFAKILNNSVKLPIFIKKTSGIRTCVWFLKSVLFYGSLLLGGIIYEMV